MKLLDECPICKDVRWFYYRKSFEHRAECEECFTMKNLRVSRI